MRLVIALVLLLGGGLSVSPTQPMRAATRMDHLPSRMLWAWERPTDLRGLPPDVGVAFLAQTLRVQPLGERVEPRRQPLRVDDSALLMAVTRLESNGRAPAADDDGVIASLAARIVSTAHLPRVMAVQINFDAVASERAFYRRLIIEVRRRLPAATPLSITALASWCAGDQWLGNLPMDEVVPMLFEMGEVDRHYAELALSARAAAPACRTALGLSLAEPVSTAPGGRRVYLFNPEPWTARTIAMTSARRQ